MTRNDSEWTTLTRNRSEWHGKQLVVTRNATRIDFEHSELCKRMPNRHRYHSLVIANIKIFEVGMGQNETELKELKSEWVRMKRNSSRNGFWRMILGCFWDGIRAFSSIPKWFRNWVGMGQNEAELTSECPGMSRNASQRHGMSIPELVTANTLQISNTLELS